MRSFFKQLDQAILKKHSNVLWIIVGLLFIWGAGMLVYGIAVWPQWEKGYLIITAVGAISLVAAGIMTSLAVKFEQKEESKEFEQKLFTAGVTTPLEVESEQKEEEK